MKIKVIWDDLGKSMPSTTLPFDRAHTTSYSSFNRNYAYLVHTATYSSKVVDINLTHLYLIPPLGMTQLEFCHDFLASENYSPWNIIQHCLCDVFSYFDTASACDRWMNRQTITGP